MERIVNNQFLDYLLSNRLISKHSTDLFVDVVNYVTYFGKLVFEYLQLFCFYFSLYFSVYSCTISS